MTSQRRNKMRRMNKPDYSRIFPIITSSTVPAERLGATCLTEHLAARFGPRRSEAFFQCAWDLVSRMNTWKSMARRGECGPIFSHVLADGYFKTLLSYSLLILVLFLFWQHRPEVGCIANVSAILTVSIFKP
jgi:hypothetical protein